MAGGGFQDVWAVGDDYDNTESTPVEQVLGREDVVDRAEPERCLRSR
jgi:hypothetical protein